MRQPFRRGEKARDDAPLEAKGGRHVVADALLEAASPPCGSAREASRAPRLDPSGTLRGSPRSIRLLHDRGILRSRFRASREDRGEAHDRSFSRPDGGARSRCGGGGCVFVLGRRRHGQQQYEPTSAVRATAARRVWPARHPVRRAARAAAARRRAAISSGGSIVRRTGPRTGTVHGHCSAPSMATTAGTAHRGRGRQGESGGPQATTFSSVPGLEEWYEP